METQDPSLFMPYTEQLLPKLGGYIACFFGARCPAYWGMGDFDGQMEVAEVLLEIVTGLPAPNIVFGPLGLSFKI